MHFTPGTESVSHLLLNAGSGAGSTMQSFRITALALLLVSGAAQAVVIDSRDWRQVSETTNITFNQMAQVCDLVSGVCNGSVTGVDMTGWIWSDDVAIASMFEVVTGAPDGTFDVDQFNYTVRGEGWGDDFIDTDGAGPDEGLFDATWQYTLIPHDYTVFGMTRNVVNGAADRSYIRISRDDPIADANSAMAAIVGNPVGFDIARVHTGHWLYKDVPVPAPPTLLLMLLGMTLLAVISQ
jgi:hypothetical protein